LLRGQACSESLIPNHEGDFMHECLRISGPCLRTPQLRELRLQTRVDAHMCIFGKIRGSHDYSFDIRSLACKGLLGFKTMCCCMELGDRRKVDSHSSPHPSDNNSLARATPTGSKTLFSTPRIKLNSHIPARIGENGSNGKSCIHELPKGVVTRSSCCVGRGTQA
jgi:hypothetical protein